MEEREIDKDDKTQEPTEERRRQFREQGELVNSKEILASFSVLLIAAAVGVFSANAQPTLKTFFLQSWHRIPTTAFNSHFHLSDLLSPYFRYGPIFLFAGLLLILFPTMIGLMLSRFYFSFERLELKFDKMNPVSGLGRILSARTVFELFKSLLKLVVIGCVCFFVIKGRVDELYTSLNTSFSVFVVLLLKISMQILLIAGLAMLLIGLADYGYNFLQMERKLKMTKQEVKEELKSHEGDPQIKAKRKRLAREISYKQSVTQVERATFIVTNPEHFSIAILYVKGMEAPVVVAKGQDWLALKIREIAKKKDIVIVENKPLARALYKTVRIGKEVPPTLYTAVIEVMKTIYRLRGSQYFEKFGIH